MGDKGGVLKFRDIAVTQDQSNDNLSGCQSIELRRNKSSALVLGALSGTETALAREGPMSWPLAGCLFWRFLF